MSPKKIILLSIILIASAIAIESCSHYNMGKKVSMKSSAGSDESHNSGKNCMRCHSVGGNGPGWFEIGGSVFKADKASSNANGTIFLYTDPDGKGTLKYTIEVDGEGNFYTTETIDFKGGLYPVHQNRSGVKKYMQSPIISGQCNSCHNVTTDKIWND